MTLFRIPVRIEPWFWIGAVLMGGSGGRGGAQVVQWVAVVLVSVLLHELGHALVGRAFGLEPQITLHAFGGYTSWSAARMEVGRWRSIAISLAGPGAGLLLGLATWGTLRAGLFDASPILQDVAGDLIWVNLVWSLLNLAPLLPLDGGHVMAELVGLVTPRRVVPLAISMVTISALAAVALARGATQSLVVLVWFAFPTVVEFLRIWNAPPERVVAPVRVDFDGLVATQQQRVVDGRDPDWRLLETAARSAPDLGTRSRAVAVLAGAHLVAGRGREAREALALVPDAQDLPVEIVAETTVATEPPDAAASLSRRHWTDRRTPGSAAHHLTVLRLLGQWDTGLAFAREGLATLPAQSLSAFVAAAHDAGEYPVAAQAGALLFERHADPTAAYNVACSFARAGQLDDALAWLARAADAGFADADAVATDDDLAGLHPRPEWSGILERFRKVAAHQPPA